MGETISTAKGLSIEYDEDIVCDICRSVSVVDFSGRLRSVGNTKLPLTKLPVLSGQLQGNGK